MELCDILFKVIINSLGSALIKKKKNMLPEKKENTEKLGNYSINWLTVKSFRRLRKMRAWSIGNWVKVGSSYKSQIAIFQLCPTSLKRSQECLTRCLWHKDACCSYMERHIRNSRRLKYTSGSGRHCQLAQFPAYCVCVCGFVLCFVWYKVSVWSWQVWHSLCKPCWPQIQSFICFCLLSWTPGFICICICMYIYNI